MAEYGHDRGLCCSPTQNWREAHAVWLRSTTKKDHAVVRVLERGPRWMATVGHNERLRGSPGIGQRPTLYGGAAAVGHDEGHGVLAVARERERGPRCMAAVGHDG